MCYITFLNMKLQLHTEIKWTFFLDPDTVLVRLQITKLNVVHNLKSSNP
jgi:hypothetical protein